MAVKAIPDGLLLVDAVPGVQGAAKAIDYYTKVFGAQETVRMPGPGGRIMHAELKIGNSMLMLSDENPERGYLSPETVAGRSQSIMLYTEDVDAVFKRAISAGANIRGAAADMFWGDRMGNVVDPFGHKWAIATHKEDVTPDEMEKRMAAIGS